MTTRRGLLCGQNKNRHVTTKSVTARIKRALIDYEKMCFDVMMIDFTIIYQLKKEEQTLIQQQHQDYCEGKVWRIPPS